MTGYTQGYERKSVADHSLARDRDEYNPSVVKYYTTTSGAADDGLVHVEETWRGKLYAQTISGTNYDQQWPSYTYSVTYDAWEETTISSASSTWSGTNRVFMAYPY